jgi:hypothetical protein
LRLGLTRRCAVPTDAAIHNFASLWRDFRNLKSLAFLLSAEGRLRELDNQPADAAQSYIDAIYFGCEISHGGFMINRVVSIACEGVGEIPLVKLVPKLGSDQIRPLVPELEQISRNEVSWEEVLQNESRFARAQMGKHPNPIKLVLDLWQARPMRRVTRDRHDIAVARLRLLTVELALQCYRSEQGQPPGRLDLLVPRYLHQVPSDPFSGRPLVYRPQGTNWLLYSIGPDRVDDGGKPMEPSNPGDFLIGLGGSEAGSPPVNKGDLFYDSPW